MVGLPLWMHTLGNSFAGSTCNNYRIARLSPPAASPKDDSPLVDVSDLPPKSSRQRRFSFFNLQTVAFSRSCTRAGLFPECSISLSRAYEGFNPALVDHCSWHLAVDMPVGGLPTIDKVTSAFWTSRALIVVYRSVVEGWEAMAASPEGTPLLFPCLRILISIRLVRRFRFVHPGSSIEPDYSKLTVRPSRIQHSAGAKVPR